MKKSKIIVVLLIVSLIVIVMCITGLIILSSNSSYVLEKNKELSIKNEKLFNELSTMQMKNIALNTKKEQEKFKTRPLKDKLNDFYNELTLKQKVGQLFIIGHTGKTLDERAKQFIEERHIGGFCFYRHNTSTKEQFYGMITMMQNMAMGKHNSEAETKENEIRRYIPLFIASDNEPGKKWAKMSRIIDLSLPVAGQIPDEVSVEEVRQPFVNFVEKLRYLGINLNFAPVVDVNTNPNNPIIGERSFSENPNIVSQYASVFIEAFKEKGVITTAKHFPGHGDTETDSHKKLPHIKYKLERLNNIELKPFKYLIDRDVEAIMTAHIVYEELDPKYPATLSKKVITGLLRNNLNYDGIVITDDMYMRAVLDNYELDKAVVTAINAGVDILLCTQIYETLPSHESLYDAVLKAVENGKISEERLRESVMRIIKLKVQTPSIAEVWGDEKP